MVRYRIGALVAAAAIVLAACSPAASPSAPAATQAPASAPASAAPSPSSAIKEGGKLVVGLPGDMVLADPTLVSDSNSSYIHLQVVEGLPDKSADGLTYTFKLRTGVKFHDGTDFNADAVVYNFMRQKNAPKELRDSYNYYFGAVFNWGNDSNLKSVTAADATTVKFTLGHPQSNFLIAQAPLPQFGIQSPTALRAGDADNKDPS